jgi:cell fate regulator YaaT (PSP1 superfamily)
MAEVIGVRFKEVGKIYYFDPKDKKLKTGDKVIVETARGIECGVVALPNKDVPEEELIHPLKPLIRKANDNDLSHINENKKREKEAFSICEKKIAEHNLEMNLVDVEYTFDNNKILFYFTADGRVDFRALVKDLASVFRTRIELRQIGVRDEAKMLGGLGVCGRPFCCHSYMGDFQPVSIKMAKEQGLSLSPVKISGTCGRLMCCLKYEQDAYLDLLKRTPKVGAIVKTPDGKGLVVENNLISGKLKVKLDSSPEDAAPASYNVKEVKILKDGYIKINKKEIDELKHLEE